MIHTFIRLHFCHIRLQVVSTLLAGAAVGSLAGTGLADRLGRRRTLLLDCLPMAAGAVITAVATSFEEMLFGRLLAGLSIGLSSALVPLYITEVCYVVAIWVVCTQVWFAYCGLRMGGLSMCGLVCRVHVAACTFYFCVVLFFALPCASESCRVLFYGSVE